MSSKHRNTEKNSKMSLDYCFTDPEDMKPYVDPDDYEEVQNEMIWEVLGFNIAQLPRDIVQQETKAAVQIFVEHSMVVHGPDITEQAYY